MGSQEDQKGTVEVRLRFWRNRAPGFGNVPRGGSLEADQPWLIYCSLWA
jgi:hypothetical protein